MEHLYKGYFKSIEPSQITQVVGKIYVYFPKNTNSYQKFKINNKILILTMFGNCLGDMEKKMTIKTN